MSREIEQLKKDVRNRDVQIATLTSKMARVKQSAQDNSEETARDKELTGLRLVSRLINSVTVNATHTLCTTNELNIVTYILLKCDKQ